MAVRPKKFLGQHFLTDKNIARKIADAVDETEILIEVGPGEGFLTDFLLEKASNLILIEKDRESVAYLRRKYAGKTGIQILEADFLKIDLPEITKREKVKIAGNFPYNISSQIVFKILENSDLVSETVGMFQKEVAERLAALPGNKTYGILSVLTQLYYSTEYLFTVPDTVFRPPPKVKSGVIRLRKKSGIPNIDYEQIKLIVKTAFNQRRKTLRNSLKKLNLQAGKIPEEILKKRPEELSPQDFVFLAKLLKTNEKGN